MSKTNDAFLNNKTKRILFILLAFIIFQVTSYLINPYDKYWIGFWQKPWSTIAEDWIFCLIFSSVISETSIYINTKYNNYLSWTKHPVKRLIFQTSTQILVIMVIILVQIVFIFKVLYADYKIAQEDEVNLWQWLILSIFTGLTISSIHTLNFLITNWKTTAVEAAEYKLHAAKYEQTAMEAELQALKLQIDPHFVFNNLSVLSELILEDQQLGYKYAENFSKVYRYLLVNSKKDLIPLHEEMKFLDAYNYLIKMRKGDGVVFDIDFDAVSENLYIPPLTLQLLIENALKHNKTVKSEPLVIAIRIENDDRLLVTNNFLPLEIKTATSGIGLTNIIDRYRILNHSTPEIFQNKEQFTVSIPLIKI